MLKERQERIAKEETRMAEERREWERVWREREKREEERRQRFEEKERERKALEEMKQKEIALKIKKLTRIGPEQLQALDVLSHVKERAAESAFVARDLHNRMILLQPEAQLHKQAQMKIEKEPTIQEKIAKELSTDAKPVVVLKKVPGADHFFGINQMFDWDADWMAKERRLASLTLFSSAEDEKDQGRRKERTVEEEQQRNESLKIRMAAAQQAAAEASRRKQLRQQRESPKMSKGQFQRQWSQFM